jgi:hypothetical protein
MITLDIVNLYTNIPNTENLDIIQTRLQNNTQWDKELQKEVLDLVNVTVKQNYFKVYEEVWQQIYGTPMGSPIFGILAEIHLQEVENKCYPNITKNRHILFIARYVDDILIIFNAANTTAESILEDQKAMHQKLKYTIETESNQQIIFFRSQYMQKGKLIYIRYLQKTHLHRYSDTRIFQSSQQPQTGSI